MTSIVLASVISHASARWLGLVTAPRLIEETPNATATQSICALGSSLLGYGLDWAKIAQTTGRRIEHCSVPAASPSELAEIEPQATPTDLHVIGISLFELNERYLSDFRSQTVPVTQTFRDLRESGSDWTYMKRVLGQYPLTYIRKLFPTAGRSLGVMVAFREKLRNLRGRSDTSSVDTPTFKPNTDYTETIADWDAARMLRKLSELRAGMQGTSAFDGPKQLALRRLLKRCLAQGRTIVVVFPVAPPYLKELATPQQIAAFETSVRTLASEFPGIDWVRADEIPALKNPEYFWDLVHLNVRGRALAMEPFLNTLAKPRKQP